MSEEKKICAMCRKEEEPGEGFELMYAEREHFRYLCPDCYYEVLLHDIDKEKKENES